MILSFLKVLQQFGSYEGERWTITRATFLGFVGGIVEKLVLKIYSSTLNELSLSNVQGIKVFELLTKVPNQVLYTSELPPVMLNPVFNLSPPFIADPGKYWISCVGITSASDRYYGWNWEILNDTTQRGEIFVIKNDRGVFSQPGLLQI